MAKRSSNADFTAEYNRKLRGIIAEHGWAVQGVFPTETTTDKLVWLYTVGLWEQFGHPELLVFGLPMQPGQALLNGLGRRVRDGEELEPDRRYMDVLTGGNKGAMPCVFVDVNHTFLTRIYDYFNVGRSFYGGTGFKVRQLVWPDTEGRFPWEGGFNVELFGDAIQPVLGRPA